MKTLGPLLRFTNRVLVTDSKTSVLENGQGDSQFGCEKCRSSEFKLCFKEAERIHITICLRHDQILQAVKALQRTLDTVIRESRTFTLLLQDIASSHLQILEEFIVLEEPCITDLETRLQTIQSGKKLGVKTTSALNALSSLEQNMWEYKYDCKRMLQTIPMTNDAIDEWILYLEIQAQQLCEEQLANLKVLLSTCSPSLEDFTCAICLSIYHDPTKLPDCSHSFCRSCLDQCAPLRKVWTPDQPRACPLCRKPFLLSQCIDDTTIAWSLKTFFPKELREKKKEYSKERVRERWQRFLRGTVYTSSGDTLYTISGSVIIAWHENLDNAENDQRARAEIMSFVAWPF
ncbi:hypothetical protein VKS41_008642 [Umbelopsis sp. WA50703]